MYVCCVVVLWSYLYLTITGNALLVKAIYVIRLSMVYGSPASPLLPRIILSVRP